MSYSRISQNGFVVEVKDRRLFVNGTEITQDRLQQAELSKVHIMIGLIVGFASGVFSTFVIMSQMPW